MYPKIPLSSCQLADDSFVSSSDVPHGYSSSQQRACKGKVSWGSWGRCEMSDGEVVSCQSLDMGAATKIRRCCKKVDGCQERRMRVGEAMDVGQRKRTQRRLETRPSSSGSDVALAQLSHTRPMTSNTCVVHTESGPLTRLLPSSWIRAALIHMCPGHASNDRLAGGRMLSAESSTPSRDRVTTGWFGGQHHCQAAPNAGTEHDATAISGVDESRVQPHLATSVSCHRPLQHDSGCNHVHVRMELE